MFSNYDEAIRVMQRATALPKNLKINYHDHARHLLFFHKSISKTDFKSQTFSVQAHLFKSLKLRSFYVDLEESIRMVESTKAVYDKTDCECPSYRQLRIFP
jgi:pre-mRNA-splicing factor SYF1